MVSIEVQERALHLLVNTIAKMVAFFLAITSVIIGYVLTKGQEIDKEVQQVFLNLGIVVSVLFFFVFCGCVAILRKGIITLSHGLSTLDPDGFARSRANEFIRVSRTVMWIAAFATGLGILIIAGGFLYLSRRLN